MFILNFTLFILWAVLFDLTNQQSSQVNHLNQFGKSEIEFIQSICSNLNEIDLHFLFNDNYLIAFFELPYNNSFKQVLFQKVSSLELNFDLSPKNLVFNREIKRTLFKKDKKLKFHYDSIDDLFLIDEFNQSNSKNQIQPNSSCLNHDCFIQNSNFCWSGNLPFRSVINSSIDSSVNLTISSKDWLCIKNNLLFYYDSFSKQTQIKTFKNKLNGLALVKLQNFNQKNWLIFENKFTNLYHYDEQFLISRFPVNNLHQMHSIYFGCAQQFCVKATFDDIFYDASMNQLIIYRGQYFYRVHLLNIDKTRNAPQINSYHLRPKLAKLINVKSDNEILKTKAEQFAYFDAVELIYDSKRSSTKNSTIRIHIKDDNVYLFDHFEDKLIKSTKLDSHFPKPQPKSIDTMFFYENYLNLLSGKYIYSYFYDWQTKKFTFKNLNLKLKLPTHIEASFSFRDQLYLFKENKFYSYNLTDLITSSNLKNSTYSKKTFNKETRDIQQQKNKNRTSGFIQIKNNFLINCNIKARQLIGNSNENFIFLPLKEEFLESFGSNPNDNPDLNARNVENSINISTIILIALSIILLIIILVGLFIFLEYLTKRKSFFVNSAKRKSYGIILKGNSKSSPSGKEFMRLLEKNRIRCLTDTDEGTEKNRNSNTGIKIVKSIEFFENSEREKEDKSNLKDDLKINPKDDPILNCKVNKSNSNLTKKVRFNLDSINDQENNMEKNSDKS